MISGWKMSEYIREILKNFIFFTASGILMSIQEHSLEKKINNSHVQTLTDDTG